MKLNWINHEGGWCVHYKGRFKPSTKIKISCESCHKKYLVTKIKNHLVDNIYIFLECSFEADVEFGGMNYLKTEEALKHSGVCPNCDCEQEVFCEPLGNIIVQRGIFKNGFFTTRLVKIITQKLKNENN